MCWHFNFLLTETFSNEKRRVKRLLPSQEHKSLGVYIAPDGNQMKEVEYSKRQVKKCPMLTNATILNDKVRRLS